MDAGAHTHVDDRAGLPEGPAPVSFSKRSNGTLALPPLMEDVVDNVPVFLMREGVVSAGS